MCFMIASYYQNEKKIVVWMHEGARDTSISPLQAISLLLHLPDFVNL